MANEIPVQTETPEVVVTVTPAATQTVTSSVYSADVAYLAGRIDYQTQAIHIQFAVLIAVLVFLKFWRRNK